MPTSNIAITAKNTATKGPSSFKSEWQTCYIKIPIHIFFSHSELTVKIHLGHLCRPVFFKCGLKVWGNECVRACAFPHLHVCLHVCHVLMLHFGKCDSFIMIMIRVLISTVLLVILNCVFMLSTKLIYFLSYNQNSSGTA